MDEIQFSDVASRLAIEAGTIISGEWGKFHTPIAKAPGDFKVDVDDRTDQYIVAGLRNVFPKLKIWAEESGMHEGTGEYTATVDGVDGTKAFQRGFGKWTSAQIGLARGKQPVVGVVWAPMLNEFYRGHVGGPDARSATFNGKPMRPSLVTDIVGAVFALDTGKPMKPYAELNGRIYGALCVNPVTCIIGYACASISFGLVARGIVDCFITPHLPPEDLVPGVAITRAAGCSVTNFDGEEWEYGMVSCIAANSVLQPKVVELVQREINTFRSEMDKPAALTGN